MRKRIWSFFVLLATFFSVFSIQSVSNAQSTATDDGVDLMIICAHPGDECLFLGGALPLYAGEQGRSVVVVFLSGTLEQNQAAWKSVSRYGDQVQAVFGPFSPVYTSNEEDALRHWDKREVTSYLVRLMREYKPLVVISHDPLGEYGHGAHCVTSDCALLAAQYAAGENDYPESKAHYGTWQIQRLFLHRFGTELVTLDRSEPLSRFDGKTALELDQESYQYYPVQYPIIISDDFGYTRAQYGLAYSAIGDTFDPASGDLFDGISASLLHPTAAPEPGANAEATVSGDTSVAKPLGATPDTAAPTLRTAGVESVAPAGLELTLTRIAVVLFGVLVVAALFGIYLQKRKQTFRRISLLPAVLAIVAFGFFSWRLARLEYPAPETAALQLSATPSTTETPAVSAESIESPTPAPIDGSFDQYFSDAEVVINDQDNEHWEYRSSTLSVIIDREHILRSDDKPISYCVAHIRMRGEDTFQAGIHTASMKSIQRLEPPWYMARRYRAVLAITGDNLTRAETELKGILIRNGSIYSSNQAQDTLALYPKDFSMKVFKRKTITPQELLDQGVLNTFSFGPTLLNNYERDLESKRGHLGRANPRCGIGMVEPGYFIAITVDGRQPKYSVGMTMDGFAQLFYLYGCQLAYNLDGGSSTAMVFMGENLSQHSGEGSDTQRPWTDGLLWGNSELVPTIDDPVYNNGSHPWIPLPDATPTLAP